MPEHSESEFAKQERWRADIKAFIFALFKHWLWWLSATIGSGLAALFAAYLSGGGKTIPFWVYGTAAFDDGISGINTCSIRPSGIGSTMYEDRHRVVLAKLDRRFKNIKNIVDEIDKYIKPIENNLP